MLIDYNCVVDYNCLFVGLWYSNFIILEGELVIIDGVKRDRMVWLGDMFIVIFFIVVLIFDWVSVKNVFWVIFKN